MKFLIFGDGNAREHATFEALRRGAGGVDKVLFALTGTNAILACAPGVAAVSGVRAAVALAVEEHVDLVLIVSPTPLIAGAFDHFAGAGLRVFGVSAAAARLEASKVLAKQLMARHSIPTPPAYSFERAEDSARFLRDAWRDGERQYVVKADGFFAAAHLRTVVPESLPAAIEAVALIGQGGADRILLEQMVRGHELSVHVLYDGRDYRLLPQVVDQKRLLPGDRGPMTNGMGALAATLAWPEEFERTLRRRIIEPTLEGIISLGLTYRGCLYLGVIVTEDGPVCLEYNVRPGNPEWPALLALPGPSLQALAEATVEGGLDRLPGGVAGCAFAGAAVVASGGYPFEEATAPFAVISGVADVEEGVQLLGECVHGTPECLRPGNGRVLALVASGTSREAVRDKLAGNLARISFPGMFYRYDFASQNLLTEEPAAAEWLDGTCQ